MFHLQSNLVVHQHFLPGYDKAILSDIVLQGVNADAPQGKGSFAGSLTLDGVNKTISGASDHHRVRGPFDAARRRESLLGRPYVPPLVLSAPDGRQSVLVLVPLENERRFRARRVAAAILDGLDENGLMVVPLAADQQDGRREIISLDRPLHTNTQLCG